jgi:hypothetical protein
VRHEQVLDRLVQHEQLVQQQQLVDEPEEHARQLLHRGDADEELVGAVVVHLAPPVQRHGRQGGAGRGMASATGSKRAQRIAIAGATRYEEFAAVAKPTSF